MQAKNRTRRVTVLMSRSFLRALPLPLQNLTKNFFVFLTNPKQFTHEGNDGWSAQAKPSGCSQPTCMPLTIFTRCFSHQPRSTFPPTSGACGAVVVECHAGSPGGISHGVETGPSASGTAREVESVLGAPSNAVCNPNPKQTQHGNDRQSYYPDLLRAAAPSPPPLSNLCP